MAVKSEIIDVGLVKRDPTSLEIQRLLEFVLPQAVGGALARNDWAVEDEIERLIEIASQNDNYPAALGALTMLRDRIAESLRLANLMRTIEVREERHDDAGNKLITTEHMSAVADSVRSTLAALESSSANRSKGALDAPAQPKDSSPDSEAARFSGGLARPTVPAPAGAPDDTIDAEFVVHGPAASPGVPVAPGPARPSEASRADESPDAGRDGPTQPIPPGEPRESDPNPNPRPAPAVPVGPPDPDGP